MLNRKATIVLLTVGSKIKKKHKSLVGRVKVELHLLTYATKADLKNATGVDNQNLLKRLI